MIKNSATENKIQKLFAISPSESLGEKRIKFLNYYLLAFFLTFPLVYGYLQIHKYNNNGGTNLNIGIIQPNINPWDKWGGSVQEQIRAHFDIEDSLLSAIPGKLDMLLWSETAVHYIGLDFNAYHDWSAFRQRIDYSKVPLLTGFLDMKIYDEKSAPINSKALKAIPNSRYQSFNSAILFNNDGSEPDIHHKMKLTPFGENIPFADMLPFLGKWFEWGVGISSWTKGDVQQILTLKTNKGDFEVGPVICIESVYPNFVRGFADKGADFLVVITNDAWYDGTFGPRQHYAIAQMRAIENRKYLARCGNTGVSGIISSTGESIKETKPMKRSGFAGEIKTNKSKSIYTQFGDWLPYLSLIFSAIMIAISFRKNEESK